MSAAEAPALNRLRRWLAGAQPPTDADLVRRFVEARDADAFAALVDRHGPLVLGVARRITGDHHAAEDVLQAAFLTLARQAKGLRRPGGLPAWLHRTAYRLALTTVRARKRRRRAETAVTPQTGAGPLEDLSARELLAALDEELYRLPEALRLPLVLCCLEGRTQDEAATLLGWGPATVRGRLERGRRLLKARLARRGLTFAAGAGAPFLLAPAAVGGSLRGALLAAALGKTAPSAEVTALVGAGLSRLCPVRWVVLAAVLGLAGVGSLAVSSPPPDEPARPATPPARQPDLLPDGAVARLGWGPLRVGYASFAQTPDGKKLVALAAGAVLHTFDAATGELLDRRALGDRRDLHPGVLDYSLSADGAVAAYAENSPAGSRLTVWDVAAGRQLLRLGHAPAHALSPDGRSLAAVEFSTDKRMLMLRVYDLGTGKSRDVAPTAAGLHRPRFTPDGKRLLGFTSSLSAFVCHDLAGGREMWSVPGGGYEYATSPDGRTVFVVGNGENRLVRALDVETGRPAEAPKLPKYEASGAPAPAGDRLLLVPLPSGEVAVWDHRDGKERRRLPANRPGTDGFTQVFPAGADARSVVTNGDGLRGWDLATGKQLFGPDGEPGHSGAVQALAFLPGGRGVASVGSGSELVRWDLAGGRSVAPLPRMSGPEVWVTRAGVRTAVVGWSELTVAGAGGKPVGKVNFPNDRAPRGPEMFWRYALLADGRRVVTYFPRRDKAVVAVTDYVAGKTLSQAEVPPPTPFAYFQAFSPCGRWLVTSGGVFAVASGKQLYSPSAGEGVGLSKRGSATFSPDGRLMVGPLKAEKDETGRDEYGVWEVASGGLVARLTLKSVGRVALGPDNRTLAYVTGWGVHLIDLATGKPVAEHEDPGINCTGYMTSESATLAFAPDGSTVATGHHDGSILLWKVPRPAAAKLTRADVAAAWNELADADSGKARRAADRLARDPEAATPFGEKFKAPLAPKDVDVAALIRALDSPAFAERERATRQLRDVGLKAEPALKEALKTATPETKRRIERLLEALDATRRLPLGEVGLRNVRAIEVLERLGTPEARMSLRAWAEQPAEPAVAVEARLALDRLRLQDVK